MRIKREVVEQHLDKMVTVRLFDGSEYSGCLRKTQDKRFEREPNLYLPYKYYFLSTHEKLFDCASCLFRSSHITKIIAGGRNGK